MKKDFKIIDSSKKKELYFFGIIFGETLFEKGFQNYSSKKRNYIFFGIIFGETLLKKDFKIIVPKKGTIFCFGIHIRKRVKVQLLGTK